MDQYRLHYDLQDGYIHHWLVLGPCAETVDLARQPVTAARHPTLASARERLLRAPLQPITTTIPTQIDKVQCGSGEVFWRLEHALEDHRIERDRQVKRPELVRMWAFCLLESEQAQVVDARLLVNGTADAWLNDQPVLRMPLTEPGVHQEMAYALRLALEPGENKLLLLVEDIAAQPVALSAAVRLSQSSIRTGIPILSADESYWYTVEQAFAESHLDRAVYTNGDMITLHGPSVAEEGLLRVNVRVQKSDGAIYGEMERLLLSGKPQPLLPALQMPSGSCQAFVTPLLNFYYENQFRPSRALPFLVANQAYAPKEEAPYEDRLVRLLKEASRRPGIFSQVARLSAGWFNLLEPAEIEQSLQKAREQENGCLTDVLGLLLLQARLAGDAQLREKANLPEEIVKSLKKVLTGFDYSPQDTATDVERFLRCTAQALAGQAYPRARFASGRKGSEERALGENQAAAWIRQHAQWGFTNWNPDPNALTVALALLADLSKQDDLSELAAVFLDKCLFLLAMQSFNGLPESTGKFVRASELKTERFHPGAALGLLLWGEGVYNQYLDGALCLALSQNYALPDLIRTIAQDHTTPVWARSRGQSPDGKQAVIQSVYKTSGYRLSSAQAPEAEQPGAWEHLWQATLGPEALVFTNAPGYMSQSDACPTGFWRGNRSQPRIFQWKDALVCRYRLTGNSPLDFTHAYFPTEALDAYRLEGQWAFARKGDAYLALFASQELTLMEQGDDAFRELRARGANTVWACQMGQASEDGAFEDFCARVLASPPLIHEQSVQWQTIRGDMLGMSEQTAPTLNGAPAVMDPSKHIESPYADAGLPASILDIHDGDDILQLNFT